MIPMAKKNTLKELNKIAHNLCYSNPEKSFDLAQEAALLASIEENKEEFAFAKATMAYAGQSLGLLAEAYENAMFALNYFKEVENDEKISFLYNTLGFIYYYLGNTEKRLEVNLLSLELRTKNKETDRDSFLKSLNNTGDTYLKLNKPKKALSLLMQIIPDIESQDLRFKAIVYANIGEALVISKLYKEAKKELKKAFLFSKESNFDELKITCLILFSKIYLKEKSLEKAIKELMHALELIRRTPSIELEIEINELLHDILSKQNKWEEAYNCLNRLSFLKKEEEIKKNAKELKDINFRHQIKELQNEKKSLYKQIKVKTKEVFDMSRFPAENPHVVMRINKKGVLVYANPSAKENFLDSLNLQLNKKTPKSFAPFLEQANKNKNGIYNTILTLGGRTFAFAIKLVSSNQSKVFSFLGF